LREAEPDAGSAQLAEPEPVEIDFSNTVEVQPVETEVPTQALIYREPPSGKMRLLRDRSWIWGGCLLVLALGLGATWATVKRANPATFRFKDHSLIVYDDQDRELWRRAFVEQSIFESDFERFQLVSAYDLDGDGRREVLYILRRQEDAELICFSPDGNERWRFAPRSSVRDAQGTYNPPFSPFAVAVLPTNPPRIVVSSHHHHDHPANVSLLDSEGRLVSEYWHSGHLNHVQVRDWDNDGKPEIYLAGVHNGRQAATVVVLDPDKVRGASAETGRFQWVGLPPAQERARVFFPDICFRRLTSYRYLSPIIFRPYQGLTLTLSAGSPNGIVDVTLAPDLSAQFKWTDNGRAIHDQFRAAGKLDHDVSDAELQILKAEVVRPVHDVAVVTRTK
jgi:hypothetical protein